MLKAIAVDDEILSLQYLEFVTKSIQQLEIVRIYTKPKQALEFLIHTNEKIDVLFLDIEMPEINGLDFAQEVLNHNISINVIFLTAYNQYALEAFKVYAIGYLLKPFSKADLERQMEILQKRLGCENKKEVKNIHINTFGGFELRVNDLEVSNWKTRKAEELFVFVLHYAGKKVHREIIMEQLWPKMDTKAAANNLYTICYYIRKLLEDNQFPNIFVRDKDQYYINVEQCTIDFIEFNKKMQHIEENLPLEALVDISQLYKGRYFNQEAYEWAENYAVWAENSFTKLQFKIAQRQEENNQIQQASESIKKLIYFYPYCEAAYDKLLSLLFKLKDKVQMKSYYDKYLDLVNNELHVRPSEKIRKWLEKFN